MAVTIAVVAHNAGRSEPFEMTKKCIDSLQATVDGEDELVLIDNGSPDEFRTARYFIDIAEKRKNTRSIRSEENEALCKHWNDVSEESGNSVIVGVNTDVEFYKPGWVGNILEALQNNTLVGLVEMNWQGMRFPELSVFGFNREQMKEAFGSYRPFDEQFTFTCEDVDLAQRLMGVGKRFSTFNHEGFLHHYGHGSISWMTHTGVSILDVMHENRRKLCRKYGIAESVAD